MLTICPTPIGNLDDLTPRQRHALQHADLIACEDTRTTGKLLELIGVTRHEGRPALMSYHEHNARERAPELIALMQAGQHVVLVSDAGTPTISDPGYRLVRDCAAHDLEVTALPGPVAAMVALSASGLPSDRFLFEGFLPARDAARLARLQALKPLGVTGLLYESPHRLLKTLEAIVAIFGPTHSVCVARELTKLHEEYVRGTTQQVLDVLAARERLRGEFVVVIAPLEGEALEERLEGEALDARIVELLGRGKKTKEIRDMLAGEVELASSALYERIEAIKRR